MIKIKSLLAVLVTIGLVLFGVGCNPPEDNTPGLGDKFVLPIGQTASIEDEPITIKFVQIIGDSRCPTGVQCVWQGEVSCKLQITYHKALFTKVITQPGLTREPALDDFADYQLQFNVLPYPVEGERIKTGDYRLEMVVTKKPALSGGILATFDVVGEAYSIFITNKTTIEEVFALQRGESQATIPSGRLVRGGVDYNAPWSWHIDPEDIHMAEITIELCDGTPSQVEADLDYWLSTVQRFCPWGAKLVKVEDLR